MVKKEKKAATVSNIWMVTREYEGLAGAGGVKDVCRQLAETLQAKKGLTVSVVLPRYGFMNPEEKGFRLLDISFEVDMPYVNVERREFVGIWSKKEKGVQLYLIDAERFSEKRGIYTFTAEDEIEDPMHRQGYGHVDYFAMNILHQKATLNLMILLGEKPDIIHCQDGHAACLPAMLREVEGYRHYFSKTGCIVTIHNAGVGYHQEVSDLPFARTITGLPESCIYGNQLGDAFDPFLAASFYSVMNTVSENYARELRETPDDALTGWLGHTLVTRGVHLEGITNGINPNVHNPLDWKRMGIAAGFDPEKQDLEGKKRCREDLVQLLEANAASSEKLPSIRQSGMLTPRPDQPLFILVSRFSTQKGVEKLVKALKIQMEQDTDFQILILGAGSKEIEDGFVDLTKVKKNNGRICVLRGYDPMLANRIYAAGDFFLNPSRYEPCGLTDFIAQLFGAIPIVHHIGGLVKVVDDVTGFSYEEHSSEALTRTMRRAMQVFREQPEKIAEMQQAAIQEIKAKYTWDKVVVRYEKLYERALAMAG